VLFCDDSTRFASVNQLTERHSELAAKRQHLQGQMDSATQVSHQSVCLRCLSACRKHSDLWVSICVLCMHWIHRLLNVTLLAVHTKRFARLQSSTVQPLLLTYPIQVRQVLAAGFVLRHRIPSLCAVYYGLLPNTMSAQLDLRRTIRRSNFLLECILHSCLQNPCDSGALYGCCRS